MHECTCTSTLRDTFIRFAMVENVRIAKKTESPIAKQLWNLAIDRQYPGNGWKHAQLTQNNLPIALHNPEKLRKKT